MSLAIYEYSPDAEAFLSDHPEIDVDSVAEEGVDEDFLDTILDSENDYNELTGDELEFHCQWLKDVESMIVEFECDEVPEQNMWKITNSRSGDYEPLYAATHAELIEGLVLAFDLPSSDFIPKSAGLPEDDRDARFLLMGIAHGRDLEWLESQVKKMGDAFDLEWESKHKATWAHLAADMGNAPILNWFVEKGANLTAGDRWGNDPLLCAIDADSLECAGLLLSVGVKPFHKNHAGLNPVMSAMLSENPPMVDLLYQHGADVSSALGYSGFVSRLTPPMVDHASRLICEQDTSSLLSADPVRSTGLATNSL